MRAHSGASASIPNCAAPNTVADILTAAADLIAKPGAWTQEEFAKAEDGKYWNEDDETFDGAVCWCAVGAIAEVTKANPWVSWTDGTPEGMATIALNQIVGGPVAGWNDAEDRTQAEVVAALRAAAEKARTAPSDTQPGTQPGLDGEVNQSPANKEQDQ